MSKRFWYFLNAIILLFVVGLRASHADSADVAVERILHGAEAPPGLVFEIAVRDEKGLEWALPRIRDYANRLRERFPQISLAVVSHGREQFALRAGKERQYPKVHADVQQLVREDVPVHICETHAARRGVAPEAFPEYVTVSPAGPTQVRDFQELGYVVVKLTAP
jgi:intracellular sulfur oxidation DsrE/DsrF family protein